MENAQPSPPPFENPEYEACLQTALKELPIADRLKTITLSNIFREKDKLEDQLDLEIRKVEFKYHQLMIPLYEKISLVVDGKHVPTGGDLAGIDKYCTPEEAQKPEEKHTAEPIADFWLNAMLNCEELVNEIQVKDKGALRALKNIILTINEENFNYTLDFHFAPNDYFTNEKLTKTIFMRKFDEPTHTEGTVIDWKPGQNLTKKIQKKKKKTSKMSQAVIEKKEVDDWRSFFNFFKNSKVEDLDVSNSSVGEDEATRFDTDFDIAEAIKDHLIPNSMDYYLGLIEEEEDDYVTDDGNGDEDSIETGDEAVLEQQNQNQPQAS